MKLSFHMDNRKRHDRGRHWVNMTGIIWAGKAWSNAPSLHWQFVAPDRHPGISLRLDDDEEPLHFYIGLGLFTLFLSLDAAWTRRLARRHLKPAYSDRQLSLRFFDNAVWWSLWMRDDEHRSTDPKWRRGSWHPLDTFLGRMKHSKQVLSSTVTTFQMPEATYVATVELSEDTWKRPRWPWAKRIRRATVDVPLPPMFAGKGENGWDMDDDGIYSSTMPASTVEEAIAAYVASVLRNRERYGMPSQVEP